MPLGDGIYFATNPRIALRYCRNIPEPYMYKVRITKENMRRGSWSPEAIKRQNIWSAFTTLGDGSHEIAVFNPKAITVLKKVKMKSGLAENPAETLDQFFSRISSLNLSLCLVRFPKGNIDDMKFTGPVPNSKLEEQERVQVCLFEGKFDPSRLDMLKSPRYSKPYGELVGYVSLKKPPYPCNGALIVGSSALASKYQRQGLGTFMYMCAMYAFGPIISDRQSVSDKALAMYSRLDRRFAQFDAVMLDDVYEPETPPTEDDCWIYEGWSDDDEAVMTLNKSYQMRPHVKKQMKPVFDRMVKRFHSRVLNPIQKLPNWRLVMPEVLVNYWRQSSDLFNEEYE